MSAVFVWLETREEQLCPASLHALNAAAQLAHAQAVPLTALICDPTAEKLAHAIHGPLTSIMIYETIPDPEILAQWFTQLAQTQHACAFIAADSTLARQAFAFSAADTNRPLLTGIHALHHTADNALWLKQRALARRTELTYALPQLMPCYLTIDPRGFPAIPQPDTSTTAPTISRTDLPIAQSPIAIEETQLQTPPQRLSDARAIVAGGRGITAQTPDAAAFNQLLAPLAEALGASLAASRGAVDAGCATPDQQIGQTGLYVMPDLYIACGISGAAQHIAGMQHSRVIVAINQDASAPIFEIAHYGLQGDLHILMPLLRDELNKRKFAIR